MKNKELNVFVVASIIALLSAVFLSPNHDYWRYTIQWQDFLSSGVVTSYYGPIHNLFAFPYALFDKLPQLIFISFYIVAAYFIVYDLVKNPISFKHYLLIIISLFFNPLFLVFGIAYGSNDVIISALIILGIIFYEKNKENHALIFFSMGILIKFIPGFIIPFLITSKKQINWLFGLRLFFVIAILVLIFFGLWGTQIFQILVPNEDNVSKMFSLFRYLRGEYSPLAYFGLDNIDNLSVPLTLILLLAYFIAHFKFELNRLVSTFISISILLLFYKIGHHQFYLTLFVLLVFLFLNFKQELLKQPILLISSSIFFVYVFLMSIIYYFSGGYQGPFAIVREWMGLISFALQSIMTICFIIFNLRFSRTQ